MTDKERMLLARKGGIRNDAVRHELPGLYHGAGRNNSEMVCIRVVRTRFRRIPCEKCKALRL